MTARQDVTAIVVCGGRSSRLGVDKTRQTLGSATVLDHLLLSLPADWQVVAVGQPRPTERPVSWTLEDPPGGGPLAAVGAGLACTATSFVVVVAGDMPFAGPAAEAVVGALGDADVGVSSVSATGGDGRANPLLTAYKTEAARHALPSHTANQPAHRLLDAVATDRLRVDDEWLLDVDTTADLETARARVAGQQT